MPVDKDFDSQHWEQDVSLGKYWAALRQDSVVAIIQMHVPKDIDFDLFRDKAIQCLAVLGDVKSGELIERDGERYFIRRQNHANRGKAVRHPQEYHIPQYRMPIETNSKV